MKKISQADYASFRPEDMPHSNINLLYSNSECLSDSFPDSKIICPLGKTALEECREDQQISDSDFNPYDVEEEPDDSPLTKSKLGKMSFVRKKPFIKRVIRTIPKGSIRGSVFTLFSGAVGAGVLSIPMVFSYYGLVIGILVVLFNGFLAYTSYASLFTAIIKSGKKRYPNLISYYLGRGNAKIFSYLLLGVTFLSCDIYICISWNQIQSMYDEFGLVDLDKDAHGNILSYTPRMWMIRSLTLGALMILLLPMSMMKNMSAMRYMSIFNMCVLVYTLFVAIFQLNSYISHSKSQGDYQIEYISKKPSMNWLAGFGTIILSYMCHPNFFYVRNEQLKPSKPRVKKILVYSIGFETFFYLVIGIVGYLTLGDKLMVPLFILRPKVSPDDSDIMMKISIILFQILSQTNLGINQLPCREQYLSIIGKTKSKKHRNCTAIVVISLGFIITILYPDIMVIFGISGGLFCTFIGWVFPYLIMIKMMPEKKWYERPKLWYYIAYFFVIFISVGATLQSIVKFDF